MKVRYNSAALVDLDEIFAYIAADNHSAAAELVELFSTLYRLSD